MKIIKPQRLGLLTHTFENDGRAYFVITAMAYYAFGEEDRPLHEAAMWTMIPEEAGPQTVFDAGMTKQRAEVLVAGKALALGGKPVPARSVRLRVLRGTRALVEKELYVVGDRRWELGGPSDPEPFVQMPVAWERAFGGQDFPDNPLGKGAAPVEVDGKKVHFLPNIEDPKRLVRKKGERAAPVCFAPVDQTWPARMRKAGTYDDEWLKTRFPGLAADIDWTFFNAAPEDQQIQGYFTGEETFEVHGMNAAETVVSTRLPRLRPRLFILQRRNGEEAFREAAARIDTVWLFPNAKRAVVLYRGMLEVEEDDAADVVHVVAAFERPGEPRSPTHYRSVIDKRNDKKHGAIYALADDDLMPSRASDDPKTEAPEETFNDMMGVVERENLLQKRLEKQADKELEAMRAEFLAAGFDPKKVDAHIEEQRQKQKQVEPPKDPAELVAFLERVEGESEAAKKQADEVQAQLEAEARAELEKIGVDYDETVKRTKGQGGGPPKFSADKELAWLRDQAELGRNAGVPLPHAEAKLADPAFEKTLRETEEKLFEVYRRYGHLSPSASSKDAEESRAFRQSIEAALDRNESLAGRDFTGVDFAGIDLSGADLTRALLEQANLAGAKLRGANLTDAMLARANLEGADLDGAKLVGTNLGFANLKKAKLSGGVDCAGAIFWKAELEEAKLPEAKLEGAQFIETNLAKADLAGASGAKALFLKVRLDEANFARAALREAIFLESTVEKANYAGADLGEATFVKVRGDGASFAGASLEGARMVLETSFAGADFRGARFKRTCMRTTGFAGADFTAAEMPEVDFSECDLSGAKMRGVMADGSLFIRTNLSGADLVAASLKMVILQKAKLWGTDLRGANLFRSDMAKVKLDTKTNLRDALLTEVRVVPERRRPEGAS
ncbi:DUF2169 family type VI secretion system accessory protein [Polyangium sorediatum]|uniref:DUF2169 domain-containing protein n=1 Tax=Polyangium sorediatum TaxID=889274 RepID=A0ABT6P097_9BACT|nr:DUF2169 domain-containing protein [Polyangium sorediatum]MDI1433993.1 DUF2169 domain-containing protein [Polyangium sorediatum]